MPGPARSQVELVPLDVPAEPRYAAPTTKPENRLRVASFNINQGILSRMPELTQLMDKYCIDILLIQDAGTRNATDLRMICSEAGRHKLRYIDHSFVPCENGTYSDTDLHWLRSKVLKPQTKTPDGFPEATPRQTLAILMRQDVPAEAVITGLPMRRFMRVDVNTAGARLSIVNVYAPSSGASTEDMTNFYDGLAAGMASCAQRTIVAGDFNATLRAPADRKQGADRSNKRDNAHVAFLTRVQLVDAAARAGEPRRPTYVSSTSWSRIDAITASAGALDLLGQVHTVEMGSDHNLIFSDVAVELERVPTFRPPPTTRVFSTPGLTKPGADPDPRWLEYQRLLTEELNEANALELAVRLERAMDGPEASSVIDDIDAQLLAATVKTATAVFGRRRRRRSKPLFSKKVYRAIQTKRRLLKLVKELKEGNHRGAQIRASQLQSVLGQGPVDVSVVKRTLRKLSRAVRKEVAGKQAADFAVFQKRMEKRSAGGGDWSEAGRFNGKNYGRQSLSHVVVGDTTYTDPAEVNRLIYEYECRTRKQPPPPAWDKEEAPPWDATRMPRPAVDMAQPRATEERWAKALKYLKPKKAPGEDGITAELVRSMPQHLLELLRCLVDACLVHGHVPTRWKAVRGTLLHKSSTLAATNLDNYRGIALVVAFLRITDRVVYECAIKYAEDNEILDKHQFGFRAGHGVHQAALILDQLVDHAQRNQRPLRIAFADIRKAFPSVAHKLLVKELELVGMGELGRYVEAVYPGVTYQVVTTHGKAEPVPWQAGVMEGMTTSPLLFAIYINVLLRWIRATSEPYALGDIRISVLAFADDTAYPSGSDEGVQDTLRKVELWGYHYGNVLHAGKTFVVGNTDPTQTISIPNEIFPERFRDPRRGAVFIEQRGPQATYRYLGFLRTLEDRETAHWDALVERTTKALYNIARIPATPWFTIRMVEAMVSSQITFCAGLVHLSAERLETLENMVCLALTKKIRPGPCWCYDMFRSMGVAGRQSLRTTYHAATVATVVREICANELVHDVVAANMLDVVNAHKGHQPWSAIWYQREALHGSCIGDVAIGLKRFGMRVSFTSGPLATHLRVPVIAANCLESRRVAAGYFEATPAMAQLLADNTGLAHPIPVTILRSRINGVPQRALMRQEEARASGTHTHMNRKLYTAWMATFCRKENGMYRVRADLWPDLSRRVTPRLAASPGAIKVVVVPSAKAIHGKRGPQEVAASVWSCDNDELCTAVKPGCAQTCYHAVAVALLWVVRKVDPTQELHVMTPLAMDQAVGSWADKPAGVKARHPYANTMSMLCDAIEERRATTKLVTMPTDEASTFDDRITDDLINPAQGPRGAGGGGRIRSMAAQARSVPMPPLEIARRPTRVVVHDLDMRVLFEGKLAELLRNKEEPAAFEACRRRAPLFIGEPAHPWTWQYPVTTKDGMRVWRARMELLVTNEYMVNVLNIPLPHIGEVCPCGSPEDPETETTRHVVVECPLYEEIRKRKMGAFYRERQPGPATVAEFRRALGYVGEQEDESEGDLEARKARARAAIRTFHAVWKSRCIRMAQVKAAYERANARARAEEVPEEGA